MENELPFEVREFSTPAHQASQAAALVNCNLGAIVKSLVFENTLNRKLLLALASGKNRVDLIKLSALAGSPIKTAHPKTVLAKTGYPVGAVPPWGLQGIHQTMVDEDLMHFVYIWASAGAVDILMKVTPSALIKLTAGQVENIKQKETSCKENV